MRDGGQFPQAGMSDDAVFSAKCGKERNIIFIGHMKYHVSSLVVIFLFTCVICGHNTWIKKYLLF